MENEVRLIDANALVRFIDPGHLRNQFELCFSEDDVVSMIRNAPTIDPESLRPVGRWEMRGGRRYCTNCLKGACVTRDIDDFWYTLATDYCPNCGAKMTNDERETTK